MSGLRNRMITRCSLVVRLVDVWTRKTPGAQEVSVSLEGYVKRPIRKEDGSYLFLDVETDSAFLEVRSTHYLPVRQELLLSVLNPISPIVTIPLLPSGFYPQPSGSTGLRSRVLDASGSPAADALITAYATDEAAARGRLSQELAEPGDTWLKAGSWQGASTAGETFLLRGREAEELVQLAELAPGGMIRLEKPISNAYRRGALLLPAVSTRSGSEGTVILPFRGTLPSKFGVAIRAALGQAAGTADWTAIAGEVAAMPDITISN
ncbi:hypothetical protein [Paenibacillus sp. NPDC058174]|uniref:hypothetical protein n=1 Tax=Paenibacillus sp. NPDC058174 TaxID=3346366 RepID=UPI0036DD527D